MDTRQSKQEGVRTVAVRLPAELANKLDDLERLLDRTTSDVLRLIIEQAEVADLIPYMVKDIVLMEAQAGQYAEV